MKEPSESYVEWHCRACTRAHFTPTINGVPDWTPPTGWTHGHDRFARAQCPACSHKEASK